MQLTRLYVKNFGPIKEADIELGDLTVITGAQNSGKSYLATLIYALSNDLTNKLYSLPSEIMRELGVVYDVNTLRSVVEEKRDVINKYLDDSKFISDHVGIESILKRHFLREDIIRVSSKSMEIMAEYANGVRYKVEIRKRKRRGKEKEREKESVELIEYNALEGKKDNLISEWINNPITYPTFTTRTPYVLFIPVERMLILSLFALTVSLILEYLVKYSEIFTIKAHISSYLQVLQGILAKPSHYEILHIGSLSIEKGEKLPLTTLYFYDKERNVTLPLHAAGSGIIQLAGIILPLSFSLNRVSSASNHISSELVIIEEPEVNLHADMHLKVADYIADKIAEGRKMVITTHSEYLLARLAQLYAGGKIKDMKVYYIDRRDRVERLDIDEERGEIELPEGIRDAIDTLARDALNLIKV